MEKPRLELMSDHEMLMELVAEKRRQDTVRTVKLCIYLILAAVVCVLLFIYVPRIIEAYRSAKATLNQSKEITDKLQSTFSKVDFEKMQSTLEKMDFDELQQSLETVRSFLNRLQTIFGGF